VNLPPEPSEVCDDAMRQSLGELARAPAIATFLAYAPAGGSPEHREAGRLWCAERGITAAIDRVLVCGGAQQALTAILSAHCEPGDTVLAEALTYPGFLAAARILRLRVIGVPMDGDGIVPDALLHACKVHRPRLLLTTPTLQNPTAAVMSVGRRRRVASVIRDREILVVEDDTYGPLAPNAPRPVSALVPELSYYVSSFSKAVTPALRAAFVIAPTGAHATRVSRHLQATGWLVPPIMAEIAARWISSGTATKIVADRRREAEARQTLLRGALALPRSAGSPHALHHWLELPRQWERASDFVDTLRRRGVLVTTGDAFAVDTAQPVRAVRMSLGAAPSRDALANALDVLAAVLREDPEPTRPAR
jgi:DNA-binding transcriptional MocR family regulator